MHIFHKWSNWQDIKISDEAIANCTPVPIIMTRQIIVQQKRCVVCNMVKTRTS